MRGGIEREDHVAACRVGLDGLGQQAVQRERLVVAARHQAFDDIAADRLHREALDDQRIEAVEGAEHAFGQTAAFGRIRIDIRQGAKAIRQGSRAMHGDGGGGNRRGRDLGRVGRGKTHRAKERGGQHKGAAW